MDCAHDKSLEAYLHGVAAESPRFITGKLSGLAAVQEEHGPQSEEVTAASQLMVAALQQAKTRSCSSVAKDLLVLMSSGTETVVGSALSPALRACMKLRAT
eukprot:gene5076-6180_t